MIAYLVFAQKDLDHLLRLVDRPAGPRSRWLTVLSGQDYPITHRERIEAFLLDEHRDESFIQYRSLPHPGFDERDGMGCIDGEVLDLIDRQLLVGSV